MPVLSEQVEVNVRFSEVDSLTIVWHGHYVKYFEDSREAFGRKYDLGYLDIYSNDFLTPIVSVNCEYKKPLHYGDKALVEATYVDSKAAKIIFNYTIRNARTLELLATGSSTQVFLSRANFELYLSVPEFFENWKKKWGICE
jgi:acyl-CoA thioester hydrolase